MIGTGEELGTRFCVKYQQKNLYIIKTPKSLSLSMVDTDDQKTLTGLDIIGNLVTLLLESDVDPEEISGAIFEASRMEKDLAAQLADIIVERGVENEEV